MATDTTDNYLVPCGHSYDTHCLGISWAFC